MFWPEFLGIRGGKFRRNLKVNHSHSTIRFFSGHTDIAEEIEIHLVTAVIIHFAASTKYIPDTIDIKKTIKFNNY